MPPRENPIDWLGQFVEVRQTQEPHLVWNTTNGYRARRTYIDEMADQWRTRLEDEIRERVYQELTRPFEIEHEPVATAAATEATFTANNTFVNEELLRTLMGDWTVSPTVAKVEVEPEDVDPDEFEKILNGG
ncbi:MAG: hypothetical protein IJN78_08030 [Clostridia bacterium]|nr:hypothetical protein [Clostridia bacterium]